MHHWYFCQACMHIEARLLRATRVDLPLTTGMAAVFLCTVHSACTLDLPDSRLHRSQASTRDMLICIWPVWFSGFYPRCACMQTRLYGMPKRHSKCSQSCHVQQYSTCRFLSFWTGQYSLLVHSEVTGIVYSELWFMPCWLRIIMFMHLVHAFDLWHCYYCTKH